MSRAIRWRSRFLLGIILFHTMLASPLVKRDVVQMLTQVEDSQSSLSEVKPVVLSEDTFGPNLDERGDRDKRLLKLKTLGLGALGIKAAKAVGAKVIGVGAKAAAVGAKALTAKVVKAGVAAKAVAAGAIGLKATAVGAKVAAAVAGLGIKAFLLKLIFGKVNQLLSYKERLLKQFEAKNRQQNVAFNAQVFGVKTHFIPAAPIPAAPIPAAAIPAAAIPDAAIPAAPIPAGPFPAGPESGSSSPPQRQRPQKPQNSTEDIPEFDRNKINLAIPDSLVSPAFESVNGISMIIGRVVQNTAERFARLIEALKPIFGRKFGISVTSNKRQSDKTTTTPEPQLQPYDAFTPDSPRLVTNQEIPDFVPLPDYYPQEIDQQSPIRSSYIALSEKR